MIKYGEYAPSVVEHHQKQQQNEQNTSNPNAQIEANLLEGKKRYASAGTTLQDIKTDLDSIAAGLQASWLGKASQDYQDKQGKLTTTVQKAGDVLQQGSTSIGKMYDAYIQADEQQKVQEEANEALQLFMDVFMAVTTLLGAIAPILEAADAAFAGVMDGLTLEVAGMDVSEVTTDVAGDLSIDSIDTLSNLDEVSNVDSSFSEGINPFNLDDNTPGLSDLPTEPIAPTDTPPNAAEPPPTAATQPAPSTEEIPQGTSSSTAEQVGPQILHASDDTPITTTIVKNSDGTFTHSVLNPDGSVNFTNIGADGKVIDTLHVPPANPEAAPPEIPPPTAEGEGPQIVHASDDTPITTTIVKNSDGTFTYSVLNPDGSVNFTDIGADGKVIDTLHVPPEAPEAAPPEIPSPTEEGPSGPSTIGDTNQPLDEFDSVNIKEGGDPTNDLKPLLNKAGEGKDALKTINDYKIQVKTKILDDGESPEFEPPSPNDEHGGTITVDANADAGEMSEQVVHEAAHGEWENKGLTSSTLDTGEDQYVNDSLANEANAYAKQYEFTNKSGLTSNLPKEMQKVYDEGYQEGEKAFIKNHPDAFDDNVGLEDAGKAGARKKLADYLKDAKPPKGGKSYGDIFRKYWRDDHPDAATGPSLTN